MGAACGHLLECGSQVTGGVFWDPGFKDIPDPANIGFPIAEVTADGGLVITKPEDTGGIVDLRTVKEQLLYELHDPSRYITPDVVLDISQCTVEQVGKDAERYANQAAVKAALFDVKLSKMDLDPTTSDVTPFTTELVLAELLATRPETFDVARDRLLEDTKEAVGNGREAAQWNVRDRRHIAELGRYEDVLPRLERTAIGVSAISRGLDDHARLSGGEHRPMLQPYAVARVGQRGPFARSIRKQRVDGVAARI